MGREAPKEPQQEGDTAEELVAVNRYNPEILSDLENYVNEQVTSRVLHFYFSFSPHLLIKLKPTSYDPLSH